MNQKIKSYLPLLGALLGCIVFLAIYGYKILDPTFIEWRLENDSAQHFLGWHFYRSESWTFPLGLIQNYPYPHGTSLVYTDSIPLLGIPFKLFSAFLPENFQYLGLWLLLCYILQGFFAFLLLQQVTRNPLLIALGSLFFLLSPVVLYRAAAHESLAGHWLILAALYFYLLSPQVKSTLKWSLLLAVAALVHFYLLVMVLLIFAAYLLKLLIADYKIYFLTVIKIWSISMAVLLFAMWQAGYFIIAASGASAHGFGHFSMNLIAPFNPAPFHITPFLKAFPLVNEGQYEGFNYLGLGVLLLMLVAFYEFTRQKTFSLFKAYLPLILVGLILFLTAVSNKITFSDNMLYEIVLPDALAYFFGIVRSSGRLFWPVAYMLMLSALAIVISSNRVRNALFFIALFISIQLLDLLPFYYFLNFRDKWESPLKSEHWQTLGKNTAHIAFVPAVVEGDNYVPFALLAVKCGNTLNAGYIARMVDRSAYQTALLQKFNSGHLEQDTLYILRKNELQLPAADSGFRWGLLDGYAIVAHEKALQNVALQPFPVNICHKHSTSPLCLDQHAYTLNALIKHYSTSGYAVLISAWDDASNNLPEDFKQTMKTMGSRIEQLAFRGSYTAAIVEGKLVEEELSKDQKVAFKLQWNNQPIHVTSAGFNAGLESIINIAGMSLSPQKRGLNIVILEKAGNNVKKYHFDTFEHDDGLSSGTRY